MIFLLFPEIFLFNPIPKIQSKIISALLIKFLNLLRFILLFLSNVKILTSYFSLILLYVNFPSIPLFPGPQKNKNFFLLNSLSIKLRIEDAELKIKSADGFFLNKGFLIV